MPPDVLQVHSETVSNPPDIASLFLRAKRLSEPSFEFLSQLRVVPRPGSARDCVYSPECDFFSLCGKLGVTKLHNGGRMALTKLRQQGGAVVLTIPGDIAAKAGWSVGIALDVTATSEGVNITPVARVPRGRKTLSQLLAGIDHDEICDYNDKILNGLNDTPMGRERI